MQAPTQDALSAPASTALAFPEFRERAPWWGGDLQTLRNTLVSVDAPLADGAAESLLLDLNDGTGDRLIAQLQQPAVPSERPCIVLVHGLGGDETSSYLKASAHFWLARGYRVLRLNLRGAGPSRPICRFQYHAGKSEDVHAALASLCSQRPELARAGLAIVGFSLGGNVTLKFASEGVGDLPVKAVASVSAPIDLALASRRLHAPRNRVYLWYLLRRLRREAVGEGAELSAAEREVALTARTILEFDDRFVAPRGGFSGVEDYYAKSSALPRLAAIRIPALAVHALDDPWIPAAMYSCLDTVAGAGPEPVAGIRALLPPGGGHVGFHARPCGLEGGGWHDRCIGAFFDRVFV